MLPWQPVSILVDLITPFAPFLHFEEREDYLILNTQGGGELCQMTTLSPFLKICLVCFDKKNVTFLIDRKTLDEHAVAHFYCHECTITHYKLHDILNT